MTRTSTRLALAFVTLATIVLGAPGASGVSRSRVQRGPAFATYHEPGDHEGGAEPSIGVNWKTGTVMYQSWLRTLAVRFDARGRATWTDRSFVPTGTVTLDPVLFTNAATGRTWVSQLAGDCSLLAYTDDDGASWQPAAGCGPGAYLDHQTVAAGPYSGTAPVVARSAGAVYYCAHGFVTASCARSDDGGETFGPAVPMYGITTCGGLHGHMRVAPDGTVYVPNMKCGRSQAVVVSEDNGHTWAVRPVPGSTVSGESDPAVGIGSDNTVYFGFQNGAGDANTQAMVATSRDHGRTWTKPVDVSSRLGVKNVQFPQVVAGDGDRAAIAFLGTKTGGDDQVNRFDGEWHLYVALTYDRGRTWTTVDATPRELVQRGCIQMSGCSHRNLLDYNDVTVDRQGRVYVGWADGCPADCEAGAAWRADWHRAVITRQSRGPGLFRAYDGKW